MNRYRILLVTVVLLFSNYSNAQESTALNSGLNTTYNEAYIESIEIFTGKLDTDEYNRVKAAIEKELGVSIPDEKSILINYHQYGQNCFGMNSSKKGYFRRVDKGVKISSNFSRFNNAVDFFVFSEDVFFKDEYLKKKKFHQDSGFFYNTIFTSHNNCEGFFCFKTKWRIHEIFWGGLLHSR